MEIYIKPGKRCGIYISSKVFSEKQGPQVLEKQWKPGLPAG